MAEKCCVRVFNNHGAYRGSPCLNPGKVQDDDGKWYCGVHDPAKARARAVAWKAKYDADRKRDDERWARSQLIAATGIGDATDDELRAIIAAGGIKGLLRQLSPAGGGE